MALGTFEKNYLISHLESLRIVEDALQKKYKLQPKGSHTPIKAEDYLSAITDGLETFIKMNITK
jgi:hypothetical protein